MTPAEELRAAADRIEALAGAATQGPWRVGRHYGIHVYADQVPVGTMFDARDAEWIAAVSPGLAAYLVAWFRDEAEVAEQVGPSRAALEFARAILASDPAPVSASQRPSEAPLSASGPSGVSQGQGARSVSGASSGGEAP